MTISDDNDVDIDAQEDFDKEPQEKGSFKDAWDSNPLLKIAALVVAAGMLVGAYMLILGGEDEEINVSRVVSGASGLKAKVGEGGEDEAYKKAIEEENRRQAEEALARGGSAIPVPIGKTAEETLSVPPAMTQQEADPLQEWRQKAEARRLSLENEAPPPEDELQAPDVVPIVQPIRPQPQMKLDPQQAKMLSQQMRAIITAQAPKPPQSSRVTREDSAYAKMKRKKAEEASRRAKAGGTELASAADGGTAAAGGGASRTSSAAKAKSKVIVPAGNIAYAQLLNDLNSDVRGPVLAQVLSGPFEGGRAIGDFQKQDEFLTLNFRRIIKDGVSYSINAIAIDENTTLAAHQTDVDHHYFTRIVLPAAAAFLTGYTNAASQTGTTVTQTAGGGQTQETPPPDARQQIMTGATQAAQTIGTILTEDSDRPITVYVARGTTMGLLFMDSVKTGNAEQ